MKQLNLFKESDLASASALRPQATSPTRKASRGQREPCPLEAAHFRW